MNLPVKDVLLTVPFVGVLLIVMLAKQGGIYMIAMDALILLAESAENV